MADIAKETIGVFNHGVTAITAAANSVPATRLTVLDFNCLKGVLLRCPGPDELDENSGPVWVGSHDKFQAGSMEDSSGFPIQPGHSLIFPIDKPSKLFVRSLTGDQIIYWLSI